MIIHANLKMFIESYNKHKEAGTIEAEWGSLNFFVKGTNHKVSIHNIEDFEAVITAFNQGSGTS